MRPVPEIQRVNERLVFWQGYDASVKTDLSSNAFLTDQGFVLVDPIPLAGEAFEELSGISKIAAIFLTSSNHERDALDFKAKTGVRIHAHADAKPEITIAVDEWVQDCASVAGLNAIRLPGFATGETALYSPVARGTVMMGDALINLDATGFAILPDKYCDAPKLGRESLRKLLQFDFEVMTFAHGLPIIQGAKQKLEFLLQ